MTPNDVHGEVVRWVGVVTGLKAIKANQSGPRPAKPYIMVNLTNDIEVREHHITTDYIDTGELNDQGKAQMEARPVVETEWLFSVHSYGPEPIQQLKPIRTISKIHGPHQGIDSSLVVFDAAQINDIPQFVNNAWEPRAIMRLSIRGLVRDGFLIDVIDQAPFTVNRS